MLPILTLPKKSPANAAAFICMTRKPANTAARYLKKFSLMKRLVLLFTLGFFVFFLYRWSVSPVSRNTTPQTFTIPSGQSATAIAARLKQAGLIKSRTMFKLLVDRQDLTAKLQAGDFQLSPSMDLTMIIKSLTHGSQDYWVTFPEGLRVEEYAEKLAAKSSINAADFILAAKPSEGRLFPDTYLIPQTASVTDIVTLLTGTFAQKSPTQDKTAIIIASLIEREAKHEADRAIVSSVLHNRLNLGMALQIDATVQYIIGKPANWWPNNLTRDQLQTASPFNTYLNPGLPPQPIANPGLSSLQAALNPASTDYLYYVSDSGGVNHYAATLEEHNANIDQYLK